MEIIYVARGGWSRSDTTRSGGLCKLMAQAVEVVRTQRVRESMLALPYGGCREFGGGAVGVVQIRHVWVVCVN